MLAPAAHSPKFFSVNRDTGLGSPELVQRSADELSDAEILALDPEAQAYVCRVLKVAIEDGKVVDARSEEEILAGRHSAARRAA